MKRRPARSKLRVAGEPEPPICSVREREMFDQLNEHTNDMRAPFTCQLPRADDRGTSNAFEMADRIARAIEQARAVCGDDPEMLRASIASLCYSQIYVVEFLTRKSCDDKAAAAGLGRRRRRIVSEQSEALADLVVSSGLPLTVDRQKDKG